MKQAIRLLLILLLAAAAANIGQTAQTLSQIEHSVIRLHILADSDDTDAQMQKLLVRDEILKHAAEWIPEDADFVSGCASLRKHLAEIRQIAEETLSSIGSQDTVHVEFEKTAFPERTYGDVTLPAGEYQALRIEIGSGKGQNWWCVMYPAMCIPAASETAVEDTLSEAVRDMALHPEQYEIRLKCVDTARAVFNWLKNPSEQAEAAPSDEETVPQAGFLNRISSRSHCCSRSRYCRSCCRSSSRTAESE